MNSQWLRFFNEGTGSFTVNYPISFTSKITAVSSPGNGAGLDTYLNGNMILPRLEYIVIRTVDVAMGQNAAIVKAAAARANIIAIGY